MRKLVWSWRLYGWLEPALNRVWFFGRVVAGQWCWAWADECDPRFIGDTVEPPDYWRCSCTPRVSIVGLQHTGPRCKVDAECLLCDGHAGPCDVDPYT
jgi:hypothetical protein